jgi:Domain of unknown function (DUF4062)
MQKKYQIFISSTYQDLQKEREQVTKAILEMGHIPVGMEMFSAADEEQWAIITRQIDQSDYYILLVAHRYGSTTSDGTSYTEKEYDYACSKSIPALGFVINDSTPWPADLMDEDSKKIKKLNNFKLKAKKRLIQFWNSKEDLHGLVAISLGKAITAYPRPGWARADEINGPEVTRELTRLSSENAALRKEMDSLRKINDERVDEVRNTIKTLSVNIRKFNTRTSADWGSATKCTMTLADIFHHSAPNLISESSSQNVSHIVALQAVGTGFHRTWPIGSNIVSDWLADFASLDIIEPSKKKHPVADKNDYWCLTALGKRVLREFRRVRLEEGLSNEAQQQQATNQ